MTDYEKNKYRGLVSGMSEIEKTIILEAIMEDRGMCIIANDILNKTLAIPEKKVKKEKDKK